MQRDRMKLSFLRQINACTCLDRYEGVEGFLCNGLIVMKPIRRREIIRSSEKDKCSQKAL
ncbi:hypothetical protein CLI75_01840 [Porphyromonas gingivalis]|nr:hypothetical protein CS546_09515 [Porphyromonas gingivalis]ERJ69945.1 hypothetical protein HMPREF1554_00477 [Porphyromonas gingivalis F0569]ATR96493.1 hypothetical protein CS548_04985 [Porphyromonas gingivalis]ATS07405.1 hypothetical protein CS387_10855 [Porphyromonas gingivalis]PDP59400.1 hypothetical protein CLI75_01840 [Porphyromonas gingivalis]